MRPAPALVEIPIEIPQISDSIQPQPLQRIEPLNPLSMMVGAAKEMTANAVVDFATMVDDMRVMADGGQSGASLHEQLQSNRLAPNNLSEAGGMTGGMALGFLIPGAEEAEGASLIEHIFANPNALEGFNTEAHAAELGRFLGAEGWQVTTLQQGSHAGQGMRALEVIDGVQTDRAIMWHPGGGHHGPSPYYKVSSGTGGIVRVGPQFP